MNISRLNVSEALFSGEKVGEILILSFREKPLLHVTDLSVKRALLDYLDLVACCDEIKTLIVKCQDIGYPTLRVNNAIRQVTHDAVALFFRTLAMNT